MKRWGSCSRTTLLATAWLHASSQLSHSLCRQAAILSQFFFCVQEIFLRTFTLMHIGKSRFHRNLSCLHPHSFALKFKVMLPLKGLCPASLSPWHPICDTHPRGSAELGQQNTCIFTKQEGTGNGDTSGGRGKNATKPSDSGTWFFSYSSSVTFASNLISEQHHWSQ